MTQYLVLQEKAKPYAHTSPSTKPPTSDVYSLHSRSLYRIRGNRILGFQTGGWYAVSRHKRQIDLVDV
jgi:hypothetical protein